MNKSNLFYFIAGSVCTALFFVLFDAKDAISEPNVASIESNIDDEKLSYIRKDLEGGVGLASSQTSTLDNEREESLASDSSENTLERVSSDKNDSFFSAVDNLDSDSLDASTVSANAIQKVFFEESRNPEWASVKEDSLSAILYSPEFSSQYSVSNLECKSTSCKFEFSAESAPSMIEGISQFVGSSIGVEELSGLEIATNNDLENGVTTVYLIDRTLHRK
jgi:hypothetical protein